MSAPHNTFLFSPSTKNEAYISWLDQVEKKNVQFWKYQTHTPTCLKANIIDANLFPTIKDNPTIIYEIKTLLKQVNNLETPDYIAGFILDFELFLEQTAKNVRLKKESTCRLDQQIDVMSQQWNLVAQSEANSFLRFWCCILNTQLKINQREYQY